MEDEVVDPTCRTPAPHQHQGSERRPRGPALAPDRRLRSGQVVEAGKHSIMRPHCLPARDLRILDPLLSYPSTVLGRERRPSSSTSSTSRPSSPPQRSSSSTPRIPPSFPFIDELQRRFSRLHQATKNQALIHLHFQLQFRLGLTEIDSCIKFHVIGFCCVKEAGEWQRWGCGLECTKSSGRRMRVLSPLLVGTLL
ncbi:magnesium transporter MRS2-3 [Cinnamomum micranthum f. kanehirae]|uniref:Magnesium transporter MRS2-3 n=1 Tax=Cinnamomum micranthum f. kanehirae TaxID=337451 RepID=A0A3S4NWB6_9MAGN|nr:magnesium transporter MRS2-3 [Cinnamomum micranthum f. kanehirae]